MQEVPVTVLMSVKNGEKYLEETIRSILAQTYRDFRFLILDNASTDRTREIIRSYQDARIKLIELSSDLGQTGALNHGLSLINSPYVARTDADDVSHPSRLQKQMAFVKAHPEVALLGAWYEAIGDQNRVVARHHPPTRPEQLATHLLLDNPFAHSSVLFSRQAALACGGYDPRFKFAQDYLLWLQIGARYPVAILPDYLVQIRRHPNRSGTDATVGCQRALAAIQTISDLVSGLPPTKAANRLACVARGRAYLRYAVSLSEAGQPLKSLQWLGRSISQNPVLPAIKTTVIGRLLLRTVLCEKGWTTAKRARRLFCHSAV